MLALRRKSFGFTCEHVTPLNSEEGAFFFNVILPIACSKLYRESGKMVVPLASILWEREK